MSERDDDDGDDAQLRSSLRAVWLDMPEEEPPERGLTELLAAARTKAAEMSAPEPAPSTWQRFLALLRRPPVLALATVMLLIGGIALVSRNAQRSSAPAVQSTPSGETTTTKEQMAAPQSPPPPPAEPGEADETAPQRRDEKRAVKQPEMNFAAEGDRQTMMLDAGVAPIDKTGAAAIERTTVETTAEPAQ